MTKTQKINLLIRSWKPDPIFGIESLFGITLDDQQKRLVLAAHEENSRVACKSGTGLGKTACLVWLTAYYLLTLDDVRILITAPSHNQLDRVFKSEWDKWFHRMPEEIQALFDVKKESISIIMKKDVRLCSLVTGNPQNIQNVQGGHSKNYIVFFEECNGLDDRVIKTLLGTLGSSKSKVIMVANPVVPRGMFYELFQKKHKRWALLTFDAFHCDRVELSWIEEMEELYGVDGDEYLIRVLGKFGKLGENSFFSSDAIKEAVDNDLPTGAYASFPIVMGVDVARFGADSTVFVLRQGPKLLKIVEHKGLDTMEVANKVLDFHARYHPVQIFIDGIGVGSGVVDRCKEFGLPYVDVVVSMKSSNPRVYGNLRSQLYGEVRDWLNNGADIPDNDRLLLELAASWYTYNNKLQIMLPSKKEIKSMSKESPDILDSLSLTMSQGAYGYVNINAKPRKITRVKRRNWV